MNIDKFDDRILDGKDILDLGVDPQGTGDFDEAPEFSKPRLTGGILMTSAEVDVIQVTE